MKINSIAVRSLHNPEHLGFHSEARKIMERYVLSEIDITQPLFDRYTEAIDSEDLSYKIVAKSSYTQIINELDIVRDNTITGLTGQVRSLLKHFDPAIQAAANRTMIEINSFGNIQKKNYVAETTDIVNLLQILKGKLTPEVTLLQIEGWVQKLEEDNNAFVVQYDGRHDEQREKDSLTRLRTCRLETDEAWKSIFNRINAGIEFNGEDRYRDFVKDINVTINYYNNIIATRKGRAAAKG